VLHVGQETLGSLAVADQLELQQSELGHLQNVGRLQKVDHHQKDDHLQKVGSTCSRLRHY
jgi:hypothetical protein